MSKSGFTWEVSPDVLADNVEQYGRRVFTAILAIAQNFAITVQNDMRENAVWEDRTANARSGLFSQVERVTEGIIDIYLSHGHTVDYGIFLETMQAGKYAIIMPTIEKHLPDLERELNNLFRG